MTTIKDIWELLEETAPDGCEAIQDLYSWSLNFDPGRGPFTLFLDLIGWSEDEIGEKVSPRDATFGYVELEKLADALSEYVNAPNDVRAYVDQLVEAETQS